MYVLKDSMGRGPWAVNRASWTVSRARGPWTVDTKQNAYN